MRALAVIGPLSRDVVDGRAERIGGGSWYAGRALRALQQPALVVAKCGEPERHSYLRRLAALGLPVALASAGETTAFSFRYDADGNREMRVDAIGDPWSEDDDPERGLHRIEWVHVAPLLRGDFPPESLERIAHRRRVLLDGHGLVRAREAGPLALDGDFDRGLLRHVSILKLAEDEARTILEGAELEELRGLGVPEVVVTFGAGGSLVLTRDAAVRVTARPAHGDPTGAGDAFSVAYLSARARGHRPPSAARRASALVTALLSDTVVPGKTGR
ncbi:MAG TPA: PfkB family carbohydrate kinase [Gaiellaceae bacterium]|nr:PfkB family carbohydrate kinase [Gaiellaceae bacterium]